MDENGRMNVAYLRVSTEEQVRGFSIANQELTVIRTAEVQQMTIDKFFIDEGKSAFQKNVVRKDYNEMIQLVKEDKIANIFIWKLDRLVRNSVKTEQLFILFHKHNVNVVSSTENTLDFTTADGRANIRRKGVDNQYESERTSERTSASLKTSAEKGNYPKSIIPLGYKRIHNEFGSAPLMLDEEIAPKVRYIFEKIHDEKLGIRKMLAWLNSNHYLKDHWNEDVLLTLVKNKIYIGTYQNTLRNPKLVIKNHTPKLISEELFYAVQRDLQKRYKAINKYKYDFKRYVYCKICDTEMKAQPAKNGKSKNVYLYYYCPCCKKRINHKKLYESIQYDLDVIIVQLLEATPASENQKKLENVQHLIDENDENLINSLINEEYHRNKEHELLKKRMELVDLINQQSKNNIKWKDFDYSKKRDFLRNYVDRIEVDSFDDNNIEVNIVLKSKETK
ncbi:recombinase family protein [Breznakia pachnodae]|uniref:DNA invertase Pin-like site-specific DNA recombinase/succinate dehydrogenase flavin-adding protein (Antitoxin of CptAB toxin-antitoxin module) n=1 Tax=Breznakia pachnodae TaxID=265178 RepID=A0ABU0E3Z0_9FIRM|nr:recombinase family protein [Breznakia pachnodae]MDQ0361541.1 DNA invertase Pin-like site-specific DNA recombinase/succinate dehydrogenase flavin-adding protein (antitoxin of CptAB toxin-antitoxin module) [Breznakia pachnodae]